LQKESKNDYSRVLDNFGSRSSGLQVKETLFENKMYPLCISPNIGEKKVPVTYSKLS